MRVYFNKNLAFTVFLFLALIMLVPETGFALLNQEMTQQSIYSAAKNEVEQLKKMVENQKKMLEHLSDGTVSDINTKRNALIKNFESVRNIIEKSNALTHLTSNFDSEFKKRHPDWKDGLKIEDLKKRNDDRYSGMKETFKAYLKGMNLGIGDFKNDDEMRKKLMEVLKSPSGQTQAIQGLAALLDHTNLMLVRNENTIQGFLTAFLEYQRDNIDKREQTGKSIIEVCGGLQKHKPTATTYTLGL